MRYFPWAVSWNNSAHRIDDETITTRRYWDSIPKNPLLIGYWLSYDADVPINVFLQRNSLKLIRRVWRLHKLDLIIADVRSRPIWVAWFLNHLSG